MRCGPIATTDANGRYEVLLPERVAMGGGAEMDSSGWKELHILVPQNDPIRVSIAELPDAVAATSPR